MLKDSSKLISGIIGAEDAMASGEGMNKQIAEKAAKVGKVAVAGAALATGAGFAIATKISAAKAKSYGATSQEALDDQKEKAGEAGIGGKLAMAGHAVIGAPTKGIKKLAGKIKGKRGGGSSGGGSGSGATAEGGQSQAEKLEESGKKATAVGKKVAADVAQSSGSSQAAQAAEQSSGSSSTGDVSANATEEGSTSVGKENAEKMVAWSARTQRMRLRSQRAFTLSKNLGISLLANSAFGKSLNDMTGGSFKALGGKGINQWDNEISSKSDLDSEVVTQVAKAQKHKKEYIRNYMMGNTYEVLSAGNQKIVRDELMKDNARTILANSTPELRIANLNQLADILRNTKENTQERQTAQDNLAKALKDSGFSGGRANNIIESAIASGIEFKEGAEGSVECHTKNSEGEVVKLDSASVDDFKRAVSEALTTATSRVKASDAKTDWDGLVDGLTRGLNAAQKKQLGAQTSYQLNNAYYGSSSTEKRERADMKAIIQILQTKFN